MWDLWWTKRSRGRFSPNISVSPANLHSTNYSTITIYHMGLVQQASSGCSTKWIQSHLNNNNNNMAAAEVLVELAVINFQ
jgi:hypothetical protein